MLYIHTLYSACWRGLDVLCKSTTLIRYVGQRRLRNANPSVSLFMFFSSLSLFFCFVCLFSSCFCAAVWCMRACVGPLWNVYISFGSMSVAHDSTIPDECSSLRNVYWLLLLAFWWRGISLLLAPSSPLSPLPTPPPPCPPLPPLSLSPLSLPLLSFSHVSWSILTCGAMMLAFLLQVR